MKATKNAVKLERRGLKLMLGLIALGLLGLGFRPEASGKVVEGENTACRELIEEDPWEPFNETMFSFNRKVDEYVLKPVAEGWNFMVPKLVQKSLDHLLDNTGFVTRVLNSLAQGKIGGAGREVARFTINMTLGVGGLFDVAQKGFGIDASDEDTGQTLGFYGAAPGPYLVLPLLPPLNVRDGIGAVVDAGLNPLNYILPFTAGADSGTTAGTLAGIAALDAINERSMNLEFYEGVEEATVDLYSAVRNAYLQRREAKIRE